MNSCKTWDGRARARRLRARARLTLFLLIFDLSAAARGAVRCRMTRFVKRNDGSRECEIGEKWSRCRGGAGVPLCLLHIDGKQTNLPLIRPANRRTAVIGHRIGRLTLLGSVRLDSIWTRLVAPLHQSRGRRNNPIAIIWSSFQRRCCPPCGWGTCACRAMARKTVSRKRKAGELKEQQVTTNLARTRQNTPWRLCYHTILNENKSVYTGERKRSMTVLRQLGDLR